MFVQVNLDFRRRSKRAGQDVLPRFYGDVVLGKQSRADLLHDQGVVVGELLQFPPADQVTPAVADVGNADPVFLNQAAVQVVPMP